MPSTPSPCTLNSPPTPEQGTCYYSSPTEGGGGRRIWGYHVVLGGGRGGISRRWQSVNEGDRRNLTASKRWRGGGCQNTTEPGGGGETDKFKLNFSDPLPSLLPGDNKWSLRRIQM